MHAQHVPLVVIQALLEPRRASYANLVPFPKKTHPWLARNAIPVQAHLYLVKAMDAPTAKKATTHLQTLHHFVLLVPREPMQVLLVQPSALHVPLVLTMT